MGLSGMKTSSSLFHVGAHCFTCMDTCECMLVVMAEPLLAVTADGVFGAGSFPYTEYYICQHFQNVCMKLNLKVVLNQKSLNENII